MQRRRSQSNREAGESYAYILVLVLLTRMSAAAASGRVVVALSMRHGTTSLHTRIAQRTRC
jgi:hypothetical protein